MPPKKAAAAKTTKKSPKKATPKKKAPEWLNGVESALATNDTSTATQLIKLHFDVGNPTLPFAGAAAPKKTPAKKAAPKKAAPKAMPKMPPAPKTPTTKKAVSEKSSPKKKAPTKKADGAKVAKYMCLVCDTDIKKRDHYSTSGCLDTLTSPAPGSDLVVLRIDRPQQCVHDSCYKGPDYTEYHLTIAISSDLTLDDLSEFLKSIWFECCGHLAQFITKGYGKVYHCGWFDNSSDDESGEDVTIGEVFGKKDDVLGYEYDLGTTSMCVVQTIDVLPNTRVNRQEGFAVLQRNTKVIKKGDEEVNSPRLDVCGDLDLTIDDQGTIRYK